MEETNKKNWCSVAAGVLFVILALMKINALVGIGIHYSSFISGIINLCMLAGFGVLAAGAFMKKRGNIVIIGFALLAAAALVSFFTRFFTNGYHTYHYSYFSGSTYKFNFMLVLPALANLVGYLGAFAVAAVSLADYLPQYKETVNKLWFCPAALIAGQIILKLIAAITAHWYGGFWLDFIGAGAVLLMCLWLRYPEGIPANHIKINMDGTASTVFVPEAEGYCDLVKHILLLIFTCGIWYLIWIYKMTAYLNRVEDEPPRNPATKLLLCMFVPFYSIYWIYKSAQRIDKLANAKGIQSDMATLCIILAIFVSIVPPILMQDKINTIIKASTANTAPRMNNNYQQQTASAAPKQPIQPVQDVPAELKKYRELLDEEIITQEEFDEKKKQLLGL